MFFEIPSIEVIEQSVQIRISKELHIEVMENIFFRAFWIDMIIPKWFISNWNSFPFFIKAFISPYDMRFIFAAIVHDYVYATQFIPRVIADLIYYYMLKQTWWVVYAYVFFKGVRIWWFIAWANCKKNIQEYPEAKHDLKVYLSNQV